MSDGERRDLMWDVVDAGNVMVVGLQVVVDD